MSHELDGMLPQGQGDFVHSPNIVSQAEEGSNEFANDIPEPYIGQEFGDLESVYNFYNSYALNFGFGIRKNSSNKSAITKELIWKNYVCDKAGKKVLSNTEEIETSKRRRETRVGCEAKLAVRINKDAKWVVTVFAKGHNHPLDSPRRAKKHRSHNVSHRSTMTKAVMKQLHECGIGPSNIAKVLNAADANTSIISQNVIDHLRVHRSNNIGREGVKIAQYLQAQIMKDPNNYFALELDTDGFLRSIFWADSRARNDYITFNDVIVFDVTYKTNVLMMPFAPFTGVNHHRQSVLFGCALLADEIEETFTWLFQHWLKCMFDKAPATIITDMDHAMFNAIKIVFPNTRHRFCSWHIHKHLVENVSEMRDSQSNFSQDYKKWYYSKTVTLSESSWQCLLDRYHLQNNKWLARMWDRRLHWVPAFLKDVFVAGMTSTGRSESINSFFDGFVNSNTHLDEFVKQYEKALQTRRQSEEVEDFKTLNSTATLISKTTIEAHAGRCYTRVMFKLFQSEFKDSLECWHEKISTVSNMKTYLVGLSSEEKYKWSTVIYEDSESVNISCDCSKFETYGLLCKHILHIMCKKHITSIPDKYILKRWTTDARNIMSYEPSTVENSESHIVTPIMKWNLLSLCNQLVEKASKSDSSFRAFYSIVTQKLLEYDVEHNEAASVNEENQIDSITLQSSIPMISIRDPVQVRRKGRPKIASRIHSGIEASQNNSKRRTCSSCGDKGHYVTTCPKKG